MRDSVFPTSSHAHFTTPGVCRAKLPFPWPPSNQHNAGQDRKTAAAQQDGVDDAEHRGVGADGQSHCQYYRACEQRGLAHHARA